MLTEDGGRVVPIDSVLFPLAVVIVGMVVDSVVSDANTYQTQTGVPASY